ncbi:MAG: hypothetical protein MRY83_00480, partial [Flavobacteriales bacterium]|nr:hypothetical protein [Flavobacteriales bacterium]
KQYSEVFPRLDLFTSLAVSWHYHLYDQYTFYYEENNYVTLDNVSSESRILELGSAQFGLGYQVQMGKIKLQNQLTIEQSLTPLGHQQHHTTLIGFKAGIFY